MLLIVPMSFFSSAAVAQKPDNNHEKFYYHPINVSLWSAVDNLIAKNQARVVFSLKELANHAAKPGVTDEAKLLLAKALVATHLPVHAQYLLTRVATQSLGTRQAAEALRMIYQIAKEHGIDDTYLEDFAFDLDTKIDDPEARSMIEYYRARSLMRKGYLKWAQQALLNIEPKSTWGKELQYDRTLQILDAGDSANAYTQFEALSHDPETRRPTADMARLALARLVFERTDYSGAISTYLKIDLPTRERARSLNELAWSYYYDKSYGRALGVIKALKSPYYQDVLSPETFVLEMLIYRELCHFRTVKQLAGYFITKFMPVYSAIEDRSSLENVPQFLQMALQEGILQRRAYAIQQVRSERQELRVASWSDEELRRALIAQGERRERIIDAEINRMLKSRIERIGNWFLDLREQVWFLDYESSMRMIQAGEDQNSEAYQPPKAKLSMPDELFWPVNSEAWFDELLDYNVLIVDSCKAGRTMPNSGGRK